MRIKHFHYCVFYLLRTRVLGKLSFIEANQLSRSRRSRSICSIRTKLTSSWQVSLITMIPRKHIFTKKKS